MAKIIPRIVTPVERDGFYLDRARAESFGSVAQRYDRYRSGSPDALVDDLAAARPAREWIGLAATVSDHLPARPAPAQPG